MYMAVFHSGGAWGGLGEGGMFQALPGRSPRSSSSFSSAPPAPGGLPGSSCPLGFVAAAAPPAEQQGKIARGLLKGLHSGEGWLPESMREAAAECQLGVPESLWKG
ncbi:unnamed protein product [Caretta caretta]